MLTVNTVETHMNPGGAQLIAGAVQDVEKPTNLSWYPEARAGRCQRVTKDMEQYNACQDNEDKELATQGSDMERYKVFNFQSQISNNRKATKKKQPKSRYM